MGLAGNAIGVPTSDENGYYVTDDAGNRKLIPWGSKAPGLFGTLAETVNNATGNAIGADTAGYGTPSINPAPFIKGAVTNFIAANPGTTLSGNPMTANDAAEIAAGRVPPPHDPYPDVGIITGQGGLVDNLKQGLASVKGALGGNKPSDVAAPDLQGILGGGGAAGGGAAGGTGGATAGGGGAYPGANFYTGLASTRAQTPAPQLQRTSVDFSGYGSGQGPAPAPYVPPTYGAPAQPAQQPAQGAPAGAAAGTGLSSILGQAAVLGGGGGGSVVTPQSGTMGPTGGPASITGRSVMTGQAPSSTYSTQPAPTTAMMPSLANRQGAATQQGLASTLPQSYAPPPPPGQTGAPAQTMTQGAGPTASTRTPSAYAPSPPPPPAPNGGIPATGQFANPLFSQSQETRGAEGQVLGKIMSPDMYKTPEYDKAQQSRNVQGQVLAATSDPNIYRNPAERDAAQSRQQQQGLVSILNRDVNGGQPSLAELQMKQGTEESIAAANAMAASAGPGNAAAAARQAADIAAKARQGLVGQTAALRAQEYAQARGELGTATTAGRAQDITNQGQQYGNVTAQSALTASQAQGIRNADLTDLGMSYKNATDKAGLASQLAVQSRAQDLTALGMSYDNAVKQAQLEADQNKVQIGADISQRQINAASEQGILGLGVQSRGQDLTQQGMDIEQKEHLADLLMQKYGIDKNVAIQMIGQNPLDRVMKGVATGGAAGGPWGALLGGGGALAYNYLS